VLVAHNENDDPRTVTVQQGDKSFDYTLPGGSLATFTWPNSAELRATHHAVLIPGATATANPVGDGPEFAVDGDASTRWSSGTGQAPGQYLQVDFGERKRFTRVAIDSGGNLGDYARSWQLSVSDDGTTWRTLAAGTSTGQLTTVDVGLTRARFLRITNTGSAGNWWSIADIRLYRAG
jgi:glucosylceramidase